MLDREMMQEMLRNNADLTVPAIMTLLLSTAGILIAMMAVILQTPA